MSALDVATVRAVYATASTYRQSPNPDRMAEFDAWLDVVRAEAWDRGHGAPCDQWVIDEMCREYHPNPYRRADR